MSIAAILLLSGLIALAAVLANRVTERLYVPAPALLLIATAVAVRFIPQLHRPNLHTVDNVVTIALVLILFDGGLHLGWPRFRSALKPITVLGVLGTFLTAAGAAVVAHWVLGLGWFPALLVATAIAPTDPAVVFSVLGKREIEGPAGTILEGESGANDPVGIALMASLLAAGGITAGAGLHVLGQFALQMAVGAAVGVVGGRALILFIRHVPLPSSALHPVRTIGSAFVLFGLADVLHGSGFLAVFIAGISLGEARLPYRREVEHVHAAAASLGEIVAFVVLGLTVSLTELSHPRVWLAGIALAVILTYVIRPALASFTLIGSGLVRNERVFVLLSGLKGAVPILLGTFLLDADLPDAERLYGIVVIVVVFSVLVQGSTLPALAAGLRVRMRTVTPRPWTFGVRLTDEPAGQREFTIDDELAGRTVAELARDPYDLWISVLTRAGRLVPLAPDTVVRAGDSVVVHCDPDE
ncbi:MAG TPA: cation:proton antiporter [Jatrophihabitans sp.]|nr:cation:proton antiporter [Jatrophihabitans sp.]